MVLTKRLMSSRNEIAFFQKHSWRSCFLNVSLKHHFLFSRSKLCLRYTTENFNENPSMRAIAKILRARASEHSSNFCEQFEQRPNFASTFKIRACEQLQKFCEHEQASTHLIFASNSSKGQILRALSHWLGPFYTPLDEL